MYRSWVMLVNDPERKLSRFRILALLPEADVPASPAMFVLLIAAVGMRASGGSPPAARGIAVGAMPASRPKECPLRISAPTLNACLPFVQLTESPKVHNVVSSK